MHHDAAVRAAGRALAPYAPVVNEGQALASLLADLELWALSRGMSWLTAVYDGHEAAVADVC